MTPRRQNAHQTVYPPPNHVPLQHQHHHHPSEELPPPAAQLTRRTNEQLNLSVLRHHNPDTLRILSIAPYAVLYLFSPSTSAWEKTGTEGTLFVSQLSNTDEGVERYAVTLLNRRGLENFSEELKEADAVEVQGEYVILKVEAEDDDGDDDREDERERGGKMLVYGLWIFSEPAPSSTALTRELNAKIMRECAEQAERSRKMVEKQRISPVSQYDRSSPAASQDQRQPSGRSISLQDLFGQPPPQRSLNESTGFQDFLNNNNTSHQSTSNPSRPFESFISQHSLSQTSDNPPNHLRQATTQPPPGWPYSHQKQEPVRQHQMNGSDFNSYPTFSTRQAQTSNGSQPSHHPSHPQHPQHPPHPPAQQTPSSSRQTPFAPSSDTQFFLNPSCHAAPPSQPHSYQSTNSFPHLAAPQPQNSIYNSTQPNHADGSVANPAPNSSHGQRPPVPVGGAEALLALFRR